MFACLALAGPFYLCDAVAHTLTSNELRAAVTGLNLIKIFLVFRLLWKDIVFWRNDGFVY